MSSSSSSENRGQNTQTFTLFDYFIPVQTAWISPVTAAYLLYMTQKRLAAKNDLPVIFRLL